MSLPSRGVLVTGSSRGVGAATALAFAARGDRVAAAVDAVGRVDVLVNNAAHDLEPGDDSRRGDHRITEVDDQAWTQAWPATLAPNLMGAANLTWCAARHMLAVPPADGLPRGRIVNVGSRGAYRGEPDVPAYGASKAGLHAFGQSMAVALAPDGISVVSIAPASSPPTWPRPRSTGRRAPRSGRRARSTGWPARTRSLEPSAPWPTRARSGCQAPSST